MIAILASRSRNVLQAKAQWPAVFKMGMHACFRHQSKLSLLSSIPEL